MAEALKEVLADFSFKIDFAKLEKADGAVGKLQAGAKVLGGLLAGGAVAAGIGKLYGFASGAATAADNLAKMSDAIGISARALAQWDMIGQNAGATLEQTRLGIKTFGKQVGEAAGGNADLASTLRKLGAATRDAKGQVRPLNDVLDDAVAGLGKVEDGAKRTAIAEKLFGEAGLAFVRVGLDGADALAQQKAEFDRLNGGSFDQFIADSRKAAIAMDGWRNTSSALTNRLAAVFIPVITRMINGINRAVQAFLRFVENTEIVRVGLVLLGTVAAAVGILILKAFAAPIAIFLAIAAAIAVVVLIVEDLYQLFTGGKSLIGDFIDSLFGVGAAEKAVNAVKRAHEFLVDVMAIAIEYAIKFYGVLWSTPGRIVGAFKAVGAAVSNAWRTVIDGLKTAWDAVISAITTAIDAVIGRIEAVVDKATAAARRVKQALGGDISATAQAALETQIRAAAVGPAPGVAAVGAPVTTNPALRGGARSVSIQSAPTINVTSNSADPAAVADKVMAAIDRREQDNLRRVRDELAGR